MSIDSVDMCKCLYCCHPQYILTCLSDCVPIMKCSKHLESPDVLLSVFEQEIDNYLNKVGINWCILVKVCRMCTIILSMILLY